MIFVLLFVLLFPVLCFAQALDRTHVNYRNPLQHGASCNDVTLNAAITAIGSNKETLIITKTDRSKVNCTWTLAANVTTDANTNVYIPAGTILSPNSGITVTFNGPVQIDDVESLQGAGSFTFNYPQSNGLSSFISSGCAPAVPASSLTLDAFACEGSITIADKLVNVTQPSNSVGPLNSGDGTYWIAFDFSKTRTVAGWTRQTGTHYLWRLSATQPTYPTGGMVVIQVTVSGGIITAVNNVGTWIPNTLQAQTNIPAIICDGSTDDKVAIQTTIDRLVPSSPTSGKSAKPKQVILPAGNCKLDSNITLSSGIHLKGQGRQVTIITCANGITCVSVPTESYNWAIEGITFSGGAKAVVQQGVSANWFVKDVLMQNQTDDAFTTDAVEDFLLEHVFIDNSGGYGWHGGRAAVDNGRTERFVVTNFRGNGNVKAAIFLDQEPGKNAARTGIFINPHFTNVGAEAIKIHEGYALTLLNINVEGCGSTLHNTYNCVNITGNNPLGIMILNPDIGARYGANANFGAYGILLSGGLHNCTIEGGSVTGGATGDIGAAGKCRIQNVTTGIINIGGSTLPAYLSTWSGPEMTSQGGTVVTSHPTGKGWPWVAFLVDSNGNGSGTYGNFEIRKYANNFPLLFSVNGTTGETTAVLNSAVSSSGTIASGAPTTTILTGANDGATGVWLLTHSLRETSNNYYATKLVQKAGNGTLSLSSAIAGGSEFQSSTVSTSNLNLTNSGSTNLDWTLLKLK